MTVHHIDAGMLEKLSGWHTKGVGRGRPLSSMRQTPPGTCVIVATELSMKFINMYLVGYVILVIGVALALFQSGILARISGMWIFIGAIVAVGVGIMMSVSSGKPDITREG